jgi:hypothetical protein
LQQQLLIGLQQVHLLAEQHQTEQETQFPRNYYKTQAAIADTGFVVFTVASNMQQVALVKA